jgi:ATP-binding cassette subfamily C protein
MEVKGHLSGKLFQFINGISKLRISATENRAFASWAGEFARQKKVSVQARKVSMGLALFTAVFPVMSSAAIFFAMSLLMVQQGASTLSTGSFLAFNAAFTQFQFAALTLSSAVVSLMSVVPLYERARPILEAQPEVDATKSYPGELRGNIEVKHVNFRYGPDTPLVLRDVSMRFPAGQFVAVVGPSGSGKSTVFRMLLGFETPESGAIHFDNQDQSHLDIQAVRRQIGVVLQSGRVLCGSIYENIAGSTALALEDAWAAARMAGLDKDIEAMPMGMHTIIAEGGGGLSGGQRQRLMIARAIVRKPRIILFDEATSALDNETQSIVARSLESLQATRIVIAHRLSTIAHADYIYVIDKGVIVQQGAYRELIQQEGPFANLAKRQIA